MNRLDNEENVKLKYDTQTYHHHRDNRKKTKLTVSSLIVLFNLQHALSSVRESRRFLLLLLFDETGLFCRLVCIVANYNAFCERLPHFEEWNMYFCKGGPLQNLKI